MVCGRIPLVQSSKNYPQRIRVYYLHNEFFREIRPMETHCSVKILNLSCSRCTVLVFGPVSNAASVYILSDEPRQDCSGFVSTACADRIQDWERQTATLNLSWPPHSPFLNMGDSTPLQMVKETKQSREMYLEISTGVPLGSLWHHRRRCNFGKLWIFSGLYFVAY